MLETIPSPAEATHDDDEVHHHLSGGARTRDVDIAIAKILGHVKRAICGIMVPAKPNPLDYPCCSGCNEILKMRGLTCQDTWR